MAQRAFFFVIASENALACEWFSGLQPQARRGCLTATTDAAKCLAGRVFLETLCSARVVCAVGNEWLSGLPRTFRGAAVAPAPRGHGGWTVRPRGCRDRVLRSLASATAADRTRPALRSLSAALQLVLNEPWDVFALCLALEEQQLAAAREPLRRLLSLLTPDIAVCGVLLNGPLGSRWAMRTQQPGGPLPARPVEDIAPTLLRTLGISAPPALPGVAVDLDSAVSAPGYTPEEERAIQKRLEELGYL